MFTYSFYNNLIITFSKLVAIDAYSGDRLGDVITYWLIL